MYARDREKSDRAIHREYKDDQGNVHTEYKDNRGHTYTEYRDAQGHLHTEYPGTQGSPQSYNNGYVDGHLAEEQGHSARAARTDKTMSKGVLIGVIVACVAGLTAGTIYFLTRSYTLEPAPIISAPARRMTPAASPAPPQARVVEQPIVVVQQPQAQTQAQTPGSTRNTAVQPSASNVPAQAARNPAQPSASNATTQAASNPVQPTTNTGTSAPKTAVVSPANTSVTSSTLARSDSDLKNEILRQFRNNLPNNRLMVEVQNGDVTVSGTVPTAEQLQQIQPLLRPIPGIGKVEMKATIAASGAAQ